MARKKNGDAGSSLGSLVASFVNSLLSGALSSVFQGAKDKADRIASHVGRILLYTFLMLAAAVFVVIGAVLIVIQYYTVNPGWVFIGGAVVFLFWALVTKIQIEQERASQR